MLRGWFISGWFIHDLLLFYCRLQGLASWLLDSGWGLIPRLKACLKERTHRTSSSQVSSLLFCIYFFNVFLWSCDDQPVKVKCVCRRCVHPHCGRRADDGFWVFWMLWCHPGVPLHAGIGNPPRYILRYHYFVVLWCYQPWCLTVVVCPHSSSSSCWLSLRSRWLLQFGDSLTRPRWASQMLSAHANTPMVHLIQATMIVSIGYWRYNDFLQGNIQ